MSILSLPVAADTLARVFAGAVNPAPKAAVRFAESPAAPRRPPSPLGTAPSPQRSTTHRRTWGVRRCMSTSTAAGSSSGTPNKTTHGAGTWPRTQLSWW